MRLLDARAIALTTFLQNPPRYAILSHTWNIDEVTFDHLQGKGPDRIDHSGSHPVGSDSARDHATGQDSAGNDSEEIKSQGHKFEGNVSTGQTSTKSDLTQLSGFGKIEQACRQAGRDGCRYIWIDTCCIDKRSSAELSETINSMFEWYQLAAVCYAYLQDVETSDVEMFKRVPPNHDLTAVQEAKILGTHFAKSRWWTRGWTLQELIAPRNLIFYDKYFRKIGSKDELVRVISIVSGIEEGILLHKRSLASICVATRMSWAARRKTTRIEDEAYCLLGIFGINMTMLYGERQRAFIRLQEEIIKSTNDQSIFAWDGHKFENGSLFAPRPLCFYNTNRIIRLQPSTADEFSLTNAGLDIMLLLHKSGGSGPTTGEGGCRPRRWIAPLRCRYEMDFSGPIALELEETEESGAFVLHQRSDRLFVYNMGAKDASCKPKSILIRRKDSLVGDPAGPDASYSLVNQKCLIRWEGHRKFLEGRYCYPSDAWSKERDIFWVKRAPEVIGALELLVYRGVRILLRIGYEREEKQGTTVSWGKEWIALEAGDENTTFEAHCQSYQGMQSQVGKTHQEQELTIPGTNTLLQAKIRACNILEENVFLVEIFSRTIKN